MLILAIYDMAAIKREMHIRAKQELSEVLKAIKETAGNEHQLTKQVEEDKGVAEGKK